MRLVLISDTHKHHRKLQLPKGDVLIHAGDICNSHGLAGQRRRVDNYATIRDFNTWLGELPHKHKLVTSGNHDFIFQEDPAFARNLITNGTYLEDEGTTIAGLKFWGSPWQPWFGGWAFNANRGQEIARKWDLIPNDTDVLFTHGPPYGILDKVGVRNTGCEELWSAVRRVKPALHVFGHIHVGRGATNMNGTKFVNAAIVNEQYEAAHPAWVVDL